MHITQIMNNFRYTLKEVDIKAKNFRIKVDNSAIVDGDIEITEGLTTPEVRTLTIRNESPHGVELPTATISSLNPRGEQLALRAPLLCVNGVRIQIAKCDHCDNNTTISAGTNSLCVNCINDTVIFTQARQHWIDINGDPIIKCQNQVDDLKLEVTRLHKLVDILYAELKLLKPM